jgi:alpha-tubulin suppressor-like RCC1 family protein
MEVAVGFYHSFIVTTDGRAYGFGRNNIRQLGNVSFLNKYVPTLSINENSLVKKFSLGRDFSIMLKQNKSIYSFGDNVLFFQLTFVG